MVNVSKKTTKAINLNVYRNLHHHHLNTQKKNFHETVKPLLRDKPKAKKIWIHYEIFAPRNGILDTMNVGSIADKYFSDTLVETGKIPDDNQKHVVLNTFSFGGVAPMDGHIIATVNILKELEMKILLDQEDIQNALNTYVKTLNMPNAENATVELSIDYDESASENDQIVAEVMMGEAKPKSKGGRPKGSTTRQKPTPNKEEVTNAVETNSERSGNGTDSGGSDSAETLTQTGSEKAPKEKPNSGNLFGDSEDPSSDSIKETESGSTEKETPNPVKLSTKKSSIFDAD